MTATFTWTDGTVRDALGLPPGPEGTEVRDTVFAGVSTDTRTLGSGDLFVALEGPRFDGHAFLGEAAARGARGAVVSKTPDDKASNSGGELVLYSVPDTLEALGALASYRRRKLPARVVGITGSSGKTAVKDLLAAALGGSFRTHATSRNLNNRVGLPLTLLAAPEDAEVVVLEMGTSEPGEISTLARIADPDASVVTTVSASHLTGLGSLEGVMEEKLDLVRGTGEHGGVVVGDDPPELLERARGIRPDVRAAGLSDRADPELRGELGDPDEEGRYALRFDGRGLRAGLPGRHGAQNLVLALAAARLLGADSDVAAREACAVGPAPLRGEVRRIGELTLLLDCYNANPQSTVAALDWLAALPAPSGRVAVLASMLELGERSRELHMQVLRHARTLPLDVLVAVGEFADAADSGSWSGGAPELIATSTPDEGYSALRSRLSGSETVLLKGSRGTALERLVEWFDTDFGAEPSPDVGEEG